MRCIFRLDSNARQWRKRLLAVTSRHRTVKGMRSVNGASVVGGGRVRSGPVGGKFVAATVRQPHSMNLLLSKLAG